MTWLIYYALNTTHLLQCSWAMSLMEENDEEPTTGLQASLLQARSLFV